jgi:hypothetical protein
MLRISLEKILLLAVALRPDFNNIKFIVINYHDLEMKQYQTEWLVPTQVSDLVEA